MKDAYYFSHDSNARNDQRIIKLRRKHGAEGVGIFWMIVEILREQKEYRLGLDDDTIENIAFDLRVDQDKLEDIILHYDLFQREKGDDYGYFYSNSLIMRMERLDLIKEKRAIAGSKGGKSKASDKQMPSSKVKQSIVKKSKVNILFGEFWSLYDYKVGDKEKIESKWDGLKDDERIKIMEHLPLYKASTPDKKYRKHPQTYLNNNAWNDEILLNTNGVDFKTDSCGFPMAYCSTCGISSSYKEDELNGDSICCNAKLLPSKPELNAAR